MKIIITIFFAFTLLACNVKKSGNNEKKNIPVQNNSDEITEFKFNEEMHNFGLLKSGEVVVFSFVVTNSGNKNLRIKNAETDCGCIKAEFNNHSILPGETGIIEVEFDSSGLIGKQFKTIVINANTKKPKQLAIFAEVQNEQIEFKY